MINTILNHRSIRKYKSDPIPDNILNNILEAASRASTTGNMQVYSIIVTTDETTKNKLWEAHFKQDMVKQAPVILTFCADFNRFSRWCNLNNASPGYDNFLSFFTGAIDALLASQNAVLAAEEQGLGICYLGTTTYMAESIVNILELPELVVPVTTVALGFPDEKPGLTDRLPQQSIVHMEKYNNFTDDDIKTIYHERDNSVFTKELLKINKKETLAQIFTDNRYTKKDNLHFSQEYLKVLKQQGFMNNK